MLEKIPAIVTGISGALALGACATAYGTDEPDRKQLGSDAVCNADAAQGHIGHTASQAMGAAILADSGAARLRWGAPDSAWTMDYRPDRVNVRYDNAMKITAVTCG